MNRFDENLSHENKTRRMYDADLDGRVCAIESSR